MQKLNKEVELSALFYQVVCGVNLGVIYCALVPPSLLLVDTLSIQLRKEEDAGHRLCAVTASKWLADCCTVNFDF